MAPITSGLLAAQLTAVTGTGVTLLDNFSHHFSSGITAVLGANGAGKTTLLRSIAGDVSTSGVVSLDGIDLVHAWQKRHLSRYVSLLAQSSTLSFPLLVAEVVEMGLYCHNLHRDQRQYFIQQVVELTAIEPLWNRPFTQLSGGEKARVQLARVVLQLLPSLAQSEPKQSSGLETCVLLLDEPTATLDIAHQHEILTALVALQHPRLTIIAVMHDINLALRYADSAILMRAGKIVAAGPMSSCVNETALRATFSAPLKLLHPVELSHPIAVYL